MKHNLGRLRLGTRTFHVYSPRTKDIDWKSPLRTLGVRKPMSLGVGLLTLGFFVTFPFWFKQPLPPSYSQDRSEDLPAPVRGDSYQEPQTTPQTSIQSNRSPPPIAVHSIVDSVPKSGLTDNFPQSLKINGFAEPFRLVAWGARTVSFLRVRVYNVALYIPESRYQVLPTFCLSNVDSDPWPALIRSYPSPLLLRIIPVRNTDYAHLRDGFIRSTTVRLNKYPDDDDRKAAVDDSVAKFRALFPKSKLKKGDVWTIVLRGPELRLFAGENMEEELGTVRNDDLARGLISAYLVGSNVVSPDLQQKLKEKLIEIAEQM
jgi:hypothetical protein